MLYSTDCLGNFTEPRFDIPAPKKDLSTAMKTKHTKQCCLPSLDPINHAKMLGTMGIWVHDFAYELTSLHVSSVFSHSHQVQPAVKRGLTCTNTEPDIGQPPSDAHHDQLGSDIPPSSEALPAGHQPLACLQGFLNF